MPWRPFSGRNQSHTLTEKSSSQRREIVRVGRTLFCPFLACLEQQWRASQTSFCWARWCAPLVSALGRLRQVDCCGFEAGLD